MEIFMSDASIRQNVIDELEFEPSIDAAHIGVAVETGVVTLTGHVHSYAAKIAAERAVSRVKGVQAIAEEIEVRFPGDSRTADSEIAQRALDVLKWSAVVPNGILVRVQKGWVTLTGEVNWQYQKAAAETAVRRLSGVMGVCNSITIKSQVQAKDVKRKIEDALKRNAEIEAEGIRVMAVDDKVTLEGVVHNWQERRAVENAAWSVPGVRGVTDLLSIKPHS
jgi:osmotically-inducible protein OsmY